jgi:hypothetical protein
MISPSLLDISYYFSLVPCWEDEPVAPAPEQNPEGACGSAEGANEPNAEATAASEAAGDADGINDVVAVHRVFKGYRLVAVPDYTATAFTGYTRWIEDRQDDDLERGRRDERARHAAPAHTPDPQTAPDLGVSDDAPSEPNDNGD